MQSYSMSQLNRELKKLLLQLCDYLRPQSHPICYVHVPFLFDTNTVKLIRNSGFHNFYSISCFVFVFRHATLLSSTWISNFFFNRFNIKNQFKSFTFYNILLFFDDLINLLANRILFCSGYISCFVKLTNDTFYLFWVYSISVDG